MHIHRLDFWACAHGRSSLRSAMDAGSLVLLRKHAVYLCIAAWRIITHFHIVVPWALVPLIFAFRVPYIEPTEFDLKSVLVSKVPQCSNVSFSDSVHIVRGLCEEWGITPPEEYDETKYPKMFDLKRQAKNASDSLPLADACGVSGARDTCFSTRLRTQAIS